jgi:hypothetical protein
MVQITRVEPSRFGQEESKKEQAGARSGLAALRIVHLLREYCDRLIVVLPHASAATQRMN